MKRWEKIIGGIVIVMGVLFFGSAALVGMIEGLFGIEIISSDNSSPPSSYEDEVPKDEVETQPETHVCDYQLISSTPADYESSQVNYYKCLICDKNYNENVLTKGLLTQYGVLKNSIVRTNTIYQYNDKNDICAIISEYYGGIQIYSKEQNMITEEIADFIL